MTCIKTGALVWFENYGMTVPADLYIVGDCTVIRWNGAAPRYGPPPPQPQAWIVHPWAGDTVWHREDLGVTVVPAGYITEGA